MFDHLIIPNELIPSDSRFGVGPSLIPSEVLRKLAATQSTLLGTSHRQMPVRNLVREIQEGLRAYFNLPADYEIILGNGGATFFWDMIGLGLVENSSYHFICGEFSDKWFRAHSQIPWIQSHFEKVDFGEGLNPRAMEGYDLIACTLNETSTGVQLNELPSLSESSLLAIDATSGAGQIKIDFKKSDVYYFSPQKIFASEGGLYVAIISPKARARAEKIGRDRSRFIPESMKWSHALENSRNNQTYNTPAIATLFFLNEQIKQLNLIGEDKVIELSEEKAKLVYNWAESKSYLSPFVKKTQFRSRCVATIDGTDYFNADNICAYLRKKNFAVDIDGYRKLGRNQFRISLFHNISIENLQRLTQLISYLVES